MTTPHLPVTARLAGPRLALGGCDAADLADRWGTPLRVLDAADVDHRTAEYATALGGLDRPARAVFATKALPLVAVVRRIAAHGPGADVTTPGELAVATAAGVRPERIVHHGNARSPEELRAAVAAGVGLVVLDGPMDVEHLDAVADRPVDVLVRLAPGVPPATHLAMATAHHGQKFGVTLAEAPGMLRAVARSRHLRLAGLHVHVGSQVSSLEPFVDAVRRVGDLGSFGVLDAGGGLGVAHRADEVVPTTQAHVAALDDAMRAAGFAPDTELVVEPGRALVARAVVTLYRVRTVKRTAGTTFVAVDGGTSDDPEATGGLRTASPVALAAGAEAVVTVVGLHCDSGDVLARDVRMPVPAPGDLLAVPTTGAYTYALASNYNCVPRPAVVEVEAGRVRELAPRETVADLLDRQRW